MFKKDILPSILFKKGAYSRKHTTSSSKLANNSNRNITKANFSYASPAGYMPIGIQYFNSGNSGLVVTNIDLFGSQGDVVMSMTNHSTAELASDVTATLPVLFVKSDLVEVIPYTTDPVSNIFTDDWSWFSNRPAVSVANSKPFIIREYHGVLKSVPASGGCVKYSFADMGYDGPPRGYCVFSIVSFYQDVTTTYGTAGNRQCAFQGIFPDTHIEADFTSNINGDEIMLYVTNNTTAAKNSRPIVKIAFVDMSYIDYKPYIYTYINPHVTTLSEGNSVNVLFSMISASYYVNEAYSYPLGRSHINLNRVVKISKNGILINENNGFMSDGILPGDQINITMVKVLDLYEDQSLTTTNSKLILKSWAVNGRNDDYSISHFIAGETIDVSLISDDTISRDVIIPNAHIHNDEITIDVYYEQVFND